MREGFGLNKYDEDHSLYIGLWKNNMKEGFGFLKVNDDTYYIGNFHQNQLEGECILYLKSKNILYLGTFTKGSFEEGVYIDVNNDIFYRGKFINNKKNDDFCTMIEMNNRHIISRKDIYVYIKLKKKKLKMKMGMMQLKLFLEQKKYFIITKIKIIIINLYINLKIILKKFFNKI